MTASVPPSCDWQWEGVGSATRSIKILCSMVEWSIHVYLWVSGLGGRKGAGALGQLSNSCPSAAFPSKVLTEGKHPNTLPERQTIPESGLVGRLGGVGQPGLCFWHPHWHHASKGGGWVPPDHAGQQRAVGKSHPGWSCSHQAHWQESLPVSSKSRRGKQKCHYYVGNQAEGTEAICPLQLLSKILTVGSRIRLPKGESQLL